jgi:type II secretory pathway predicted ATPase ExeA
MIVETLKVYAPGPQCRKVPSAVEKRVVRGEPQPGAGMWTCPAIASPLIASMPTPPRLRPCDNRPFMALPRVASFHPSRDAREAVESLERGIERAEGVGLLVGPAGTGKSLLLACLRERLDDRFAVALLSGARICTRRGLWQSILADLGEPYRGLDEEELRIGLVDRLRGLAATGSGLAVLVDEAHTLPRRLLEELRLLAGVVTDQPAVHLVLAGTVRLEEVLGSKEFEGLAQRIAVRGYLEPLDYEETCGYLRTQMRTAGLSWDDSFEPGCDAAVYTITEGVPRLINQLCDRALRLAEDRRAARVTTAELAAAWEEIQRLPPPAALRSEPARGARDTISATGSPDCSEPPVPPTVTDRDDFEDDPEAAIIEFGSLDDEPLATDDEAAETPQLSRTIAFAEAAGDQQGLPAFDAEEDEGEGVSAIDFEASRAATEYAMRALAEAAGVGGDDEVMMRLRPRQVADDPGRPHNEIELIFDPPFGAEDSDRPDPFAELFAEEEAVVERFVMRGPDGFHDRMHVASREGQAIARQLPAAEPTNPTPAAAAPEAETIACGHAAEASAPGTVIEPDDSDMVVIEDDDHPDPHAADGSVFAVRLGDYSQLFARLRRGGQIESSRQA